MALLQKDIADSWSWWICALSFECIVLWISAGESICCVVHWWKTTALHGCDKNPELSAQEYAGVKSRTGFSSPTVQIKVRGGSMWVFQEVGVFVWRITSQLVLWKQRVAQLPLAAGCGLEALQLYKHTPLNPGRQILTTWNPSTNISKCGSNFGAGIDLVVRCCCEKGSEAQSLQRWNSHVWMRWVWINQI